MLQYHIECPLTENNVRYEKNVCFPMLMPMDKYFRMPSLNYPTGPELSSAYMLFSRQVNKYGNAFPINSGGAKHTKDPNFVHLLTPE